MTPLSGIADWVVAAGLAGKSEVAMLGRFCRRALSAGLKLARAAVIIDTLHPVHEGRASGWRREETGEPELVEYGSTSEGEAAASWRSSVFYHLLQTGDRSCGLLSCPADRAPSPQVDAFAAEGMTDYVALINRFAREGAIGEMDCVYSYWISDHPGGFADDDVTRLVGLMPALALAVKCTSLTRIAATLVETYLGRDPWPASARRPLSGAARAERINGSSGTAICAAIPAITDYTPPSQIIALLNVYAEAGSGAIHDHGGVVLKLIGDGLLAIFPYAADPAGACTGAIAEAALRRRLAKLNEKRAAKAQPTTEIYLGLHIGEVFYGNIGSRERLDFTVIGPAVNEVSRIAAMCRSAERDVLLSADFAAAVTAAAAASPVSVGRYALRGVSRPQELFTLDRQLGN